MNPSIKNARQVTPVQLSSLPVTNGATIDEDYLDSNQHMNVSFYFQIFNRATRGLHNLLGIDWRQLNSEGAGSFILEGHTRYLAEVLVGHRVTVLTRLISRSEKRIHFLHFMLNENTQSLAATDEEVLAHIDLATRSMAPFPDGIAQRIDGMLAAHRKLDWEPPVCGVMQA